MAPLLPNEIWQGVFTFAANDDKVALWMNGRRSCKTWKRNIEITYRDNYLKDATRFTIDFDCGVQNIPDTESSGKCFLAVKMIFGRLDHSRGDGFCIFGESLETTGQPSNLGQEDWDRIKLFAEAAELTKRDKVSETYVKDSILARVGTLDSNGDMVARVGIDRKEFTRLLIDGVRVAKGGSRENRKQIRRERIKRFYLDRYGIEYKIEHFGLHEKEALRQFTPTADPFSRLAELSMEEEEDGAGRDDMGEMSGGEYGFEGMSSDEEDNEGLDHDENSKGGEWNDNHGQGDDGATSQTSQTYNLVALSRSKL
ncbi:hypothetical protein LTR56_001200 [Elasticomyces elasticus]|nr:hypothetical protein LTR22_016237 [Elasticomyces elasticus]KAK3659836.1 hypothetical protein LTR56_001200 [Elasticomyces elasticus]KAK5769121.1 hypothetical protein LTS12_000835 [Elasticomyces elasticus]